MKKNKNGFTLIELLAVIVIMGILGVMVIPKISDLVVQTKDEIYIQDAKKLVAQAQYQMRSNSVEIEKPEIGECIVFSLKYLSTNDFRNPPNDGTYLSESSFVVVRNTEGNFDYAVLLIEHRKDGLYQGVEFVTEKQLNASDSIKHVVFFEEKDLRYIDIDAGEAAGGDFVDTIYINTKLSKSGLGSTQWVEDNSIVGTYNEPRVKEGLVADATAPRFSAKVDSAGLLGEIGTLTGVLTISAADADDPLNSLMVCVKVDKAEDGAYPSYSTTPELCEKYGDRRFYTKNIDFAEYGFSYVEGAVAYIYVTVTDPSGNVSRKLIEHDIHQNNGPVISFMTISKRGGDTENLPVAVVHVDVHDDLDPLAELKICFHQDIIDNETCHGNWDTYYNYFDNNNRMNYAFRDGSGKPITNPDGSHHILTMFVMDKSEKVSRASVEYTLYKNEAPNIASITVTPATINGFNSLYYDINVIATDDFNENKLMIRIDNEEPLRYGEFLHKINQSHSTPLYRSYGLFDGKNREVQVKLWDEFQEESEATFSSVIISNVYKNLPPTVKNINISGKGKKCIDEENKVCSSYNASSYGGTYDAEVKISTEDDLLKDERSLSNNVRICLSESPDSCSRDREENFKDYSNSYNYAFSRPENVEDYYAEEETKYLYVAYLEKEEYKDEYDYIYGILGPYEYKIYSNQPPEFTSSDYTLTTSVPYQLVNFQDVLTNFSGLNVRDDFNLYTLSFCYSIDGSESVCTDPVSKSEFISLYGTHFEFKNADGTPITVYEGQRIDTYVLAIDHLGLTAESDHVTYQLYSDDYPEIVSIEVMSNSKLYNTNSFYVAFQVIDPGDTFKICVLENGEEECSDSDYVGNHSGDPFSGNYTGNNPTTHTILYNGETLKGWSHNYEESDPHKVLRFFVKDSKGNVTEYNKTIAYDLYTSCIYNNDVVSYNYTIHEGEPGISMNTCNGLCYLSVPSSSGVSTPYNSFISVYDKHIFNYDTMISYTCPEEIVQEDKNCSYSACFEPIGSADPYYIDLIVQEKDKEVWTDMPEGETMDKIIEKPYCENYISNNQILFNKKDERCTNSSYCSNYAEMICMDEEGSNKGECIIRERNRCSNALDNFCSRDIDQSMVEVSCSGLDLSQEKYEQHACNNTFLDGKCIEDDATCYENDALSSNCSLKCYEKINCASEIEQVPAVVTCHGYMKLYKSIRRNERIYLYDTSLKICPEVINKYPNHYAYNSSSTTPYVYFSSIEQIDRIYIKEKENDD